MAVAAVAVLGLFMAVAGYADRVQAAGPIAAGPTTVMPPAQVNLPPVPAEVLRMSEAGMSDDVITAYLQKSAYPYSLDADQIIYLHDMGVSSAALDALVSHGGMAANNQTTAANETANTADVSPAETPVNGVATNFYSSLAPYGTWVNVPDYGWCWQPTVVVVDPAWQPYSNNGYWLWTDQGWYWNSYYSWGWAPFHYGRWCQSPGYGWLWCPDNTWGPAWVCWRNYPGYCGWAPLPPGACFTAGVGWTFNGLAVGFNFGFGLGPRCFTFCDFDDFCQRHPFEHFRHGRDADRFFHDSRVDNNFAVDAHHRFINRGIDPSRIEAATHTRLQPVSVNDLPHRDGRFGGFALNDRRGSFTATRAFTGPHEAGTPRFQSNRPNDFRHSAPGVSWNRSYPNTFNRSWDGNGNSQVRNFSPEPGYHRDSADSQRFTPTPAWRPAPAWHSAPAWQSAPSHSWSRGGHSSGGTSYRGTGANWGGGMASGGGFHR